MSLSNQLKKISAELNDNQIKNILEIIKQKQDEGYMAGFFDGEGCVKISNRGRLSDSLVIGNNNKFILDWIEKTFSGKIYKRSNIHYKDGYNRQQSYMWYLNGRYGVDLAKQLYEICWEKKEKLGKFIERNEKNAEGL